MALENTLLPNYLYEKIWDGFISDKVTLYLGDPKIEEHIPLDCFIDLRPYFNRETKEIDVLGIVKRLKEMSQEEYDSILDIQVNMFYQIYNWLDSKRLIVKDRKCNIKNGKTDRIVFYPELEL